MAIKPDYKVGVASIASGATTISFAGGANLTAATIAPGDTFKVQNLDAVIAAVTDSTHAEIAEPWTGTTLVAAPYRIRYQPDGSKYTAAARDLIDQLGNGNLQAFAALVGAFDYLPIFTGTGAMALIAKRDLIQGVQTNAKVSNLAGRAAYDGSPAGFSVLVADVGDGRSAIYFKNTATSGDWSPAAYLTGPNGVVQSQGPYNNTTAYTLGQIVLDKGSSWIARVNTTGNPPPALPATSNTQWFLLSAAGNGFVFKGDYAGASAYNKDDVVLYNNSSWIALGPTTGNTPPALPTTSNSYWSLIAAKGAGDVSGPASASTDFGVAFADATGKVLKSTGFLAGNVRGPATSVAGRMPAFADALGKLLVDSGFAAVQQGTGVGQSLSNLIKIGWSSAGKLRVSVDNTDLGVLWNDFNVASLLSSQGYLKLPNGFIIQWGSNTNAATDYAQPFPTAFTAGCFSVVITPHSTAGTGFAYTVTTSNLSTTGFDVRTRVTTGGATTGATNLTVLWLAIGI